MSLDTTKWTKKQKLTIKSSTATETIIRGAHSNFPWSIVEDNVDADFFNQWKTDGGDIRFTTDEAGRNELPFDLVAFDKTAKNLYVKVLLPIVASDNLQEFWIWGGNPNASLYSASDTYGSQAVWSNFDLVYFPSTEILSGNVYDRTGNYQLTQSGCSSSNFVSTPRATAFETSSGSQYLKTVDFPFSKFGEKDFTVFAVLKSAETGWIGVYGDESSYSQSGTNTFFFQPSGKEIWWETGNNDHMDVVVDEASYVDISDWSGFSAVRMDKTTRIMMPKGINSFAFKGTFNNDSTRQVVIGMADPSYPLKGDIEEFIIILDKTLSEEFHLTYINQLLNAKDLITLGSYIDAPYVVQSTIAITVLDIDTGNPLQNAMVYIEVSNGDNFPYKESVSITGSGTTATVTHSSHGLSTGDKVVIRGSNQDVYNGCYEITVVGSDTYTYTTSETINTSPATGTITSTFVLFKGLTDSNGKISVIRAYGTNQDFNGWVRKASSSPYYKSFSFVGTVDSQNGYSTIISMIKDE